MNNLSAHILPNISDWIENKIVCYERDLWFVLGTVLSGTVKRILIIFNTYIYV
jgi:hypothetical protein